MFLVFKNSYFIHVLTKVSNIFFVDTLVFTKRQIHIDLNMYTIKL